MIFCIEKAVIVTVEIYAFNHQTKTVQRIKVIR